MYDDLAHTGVGAAFLTVVALAMTAWGALMVKLGRRAAQGGDER